MKSLKKLKTDYKKGLIIKADYIQEMYKIHQYLFDYSEFIKKTDIKKIKIEDSSVIMTSRASGVKIICPKYDQRIAPMEILNFDNYEKVELEMVLRLMKNGGVFFDVGANIGWYTVNICKLMKDIKVFAFEPIPQTFIYLKKNLEINGIKNVKIYNFGLSDEEKTLTFYYYREGSGNASSANLSASRHVIKIPCLVKKIDDFVEGKKIKIDFIKCDVEGAELFVFRGGIKTINKDKPIISVEMLRKWTAPFNYHPNDTIKLLGNIGYNCYTIINSRLRGFKKMDEQTVETNFIFLHKKKHLKEIRTMVS